jgi:TRAP-type transport system small permease protein
MRLMARQFFRILDLANEAASIFMLLVALVVVFMAAASRYVFLNPLPWTEEVARFAFIWLSFVGISIAERMKVHFRITYFINKVPQRPKKFVWAFNEVLIFGALTLLLFEGIKFGKMGAQGISAVLELPLNYIYVALPIAFGLTIVNRLRNSVQTLLSDEDDYFEAMGATD